MLEEEVIPEIDQPRIEHRDQPRDNGADPEDAIVEPQFVGVLKGKFVRRDSDLHDGSFCAKA